MSNPTVTGQSLLDDIRIRMGGLSNAFTVDQYLSLINEGVQEVWSVVRSLDLDYFAGSSQDTDATQDNIFIDLVTSTREYALPVNCRELRSIECLTGGFEDRVFEYRKLEDPVFQQARREATAIGPSMGTGFNGIFNHYYYTVFGTQLMLAQYPEGTLQLKLWYIAAIDDISVDDVPTILHPFNKKLVDFAVQRAMLSTRNIDISAAWMMTWKEDVKTLAMTAGARSSTNALYISDYWGS